MRELKDRLRHGLDQAEGAGNPAAFVAFAREFRQCLESYFDICEKIGARGGNGEITVHVVYESRDPRILPAGAEYRAKVQ